MTSTGQPSELFRYTSGRWLYNEHQRLKERERVFDVPALKEIAARTVSREVGDIASFDKLGEGAANRTFLIRMKDGFALVARIPYPATTPSDLLVASEAATMQYLHSKGLPVPELYGYSASADNPARTEYILMEFSPGRQLSSLWLDLTSSERCKLVHNLVELESRFFSMPFPASGSLFFRRDLPVDVRGVPMDPANCNSEDSIYVGPSLALPLWFGRRSELAINRGPFSTSRELLTCGANKEITFLQAHGRPLLPFERIRRETFDLQPQTPDDHLDSLNKYLAIVDLIFPSPASELSCPILRHPDLRPSNIFVSEDFEITSLIDWQYSVVLPALLNAGIPEDLNNSQDPASQAQETPKLPPTLDGLSDNEIGEYLATFRSRELHHEYIKATSEKNPLHIAALTYPYSAGRRRTYQLASDPWQGDHTPLRSSLIFIKQHWKAFCTDPNIPCPIFFSPEEEEECLRLDDQNTEAENYLSNIREMIGIGPEGWVPCEHYDEAKEAVDDMKRVALAQAETHRETEAIEKHWIFDDFDERPYD